MPRFSSTTEQPMALGDVSIFATDEFQKAVLDIVRPLFQGFDSRRPKIVIDMDSENILPRIPQEKGDFLQKLSSLEARLSRTQEDISKKLDALVAASVGQDTTNCEFVRSLDRSASMLAEVSDRIAQSSATESQVATSSKDASQMEITQDVAAYGATKSSFGEVPTEVMVMCTIERIFNLDTIEQSFCVQVNTRMLWECPETETPPSPHEDDGDWQPHWTPKLYFRNLLDSIIEQVYYTTIVHNGVKYIKGEDRRLMKLAEPLELKAFPVDCQDLHICVECKMTTDQCKFSPLPNFETGGMHYVARLETSRCVLNDFRLVEEMPFNSNMFIAEHEDRMVSSIEMSVNLQRKSFYYVVNVWLVGMIIVSFVFCSWGLHPGDVAHRLDTDITLVLTVIAFRLVLADMLPKTSYMTYLDMYIMGSFLFLMVVTVLHATFPYTNFSKLEMSAITLAPTAFPGDEEQDFIDADDLMMNVCAGVWAAFNLCFAVFVWARRECVFKEFVKDAKRRQIETDVESDEIKDARRPSIGSNQRG